MSGGEQQTGREDGTSAPRASVPEGAGLDADALEALLAEALDRLDATERWVERLVDTLRWIDDRLAREGRLVGRDATTTRLGIKASLDEPMWRGPPDGDPRDAIRAVLASDAEDESGDPTREQYRALAEATVTLVRRLRETEQREAHQRQALEEIARVVHTRGHLDGHSAMTVFGDLPLPNLPGLPGGGRHD